MKFNPEKFKAKNFKDRVKDVPVPGLIAFFDLENDEKDAIPVWSVRALEGIEVARARQAVADAQNLSDAVQAVFSNLKNEKIEAIRKIAGLQNIDDVPQDLVKRYSMLTQGSVNPVCDYPLAIKLAKEKSTEFYLLTNTIIELTQHGRLGE